MANRKPKQQDAPVQETMRMSNPAMSFTNWNMQMHALVAGGIAILVWLVLKACLDNQMTDWDDAGYIINNPIVKDLSGKGIRNILTQPVMGNYHPITILSYALEYSMVELEPWLYHFDSLVLHVLVTISVYWFVQLMTRRPIAAVVTALLFGLSPMHVESVAWIAGRKDLFCALFYIGACIAYINYVRSTDEGSRTRSYALVVVLFLCALLSKPVAVTLPVALLLIDLYESRAWKMNLLIEKVPHFLLSIGAGFISLKIQHGGGAMNAHKITYAFAERIALGGYAFITYLWKAVLPVGLRCFYPYPARVNGSLPGVYYLYPVAAIALLVLVWVYGIRNKFIVFGTLFFVVNIALLLQFIPVGDAIVAERYSYIPYLGLYFIAGWMVSIFFEQGANRNVRTYVSAVIVVYLSWYCYLSNDRCNVWYDPSTLWSDEIVKEPEHAPLAYNNLGYVYFQKRTATKDPAERQLAHDSAMYLMHKATELQPDLINAYQGMAMLSYMKGDFLSSASYFRTVMHIAPSAESFGDYANILLQLNEPDSALMMYDKAIALNPDQLVARLNRGKFYKERGRCDEAMTDFDKVIAINPDIAEAYYVRAECYAQRGNKAAALEGVKKAIDLGYPQVNNNFYQSLLN